MLESKNAELRKLTAEIRFLEQTAEAIQARNNVINTVMTDLTYANMTLEGLEKEKENSELLIPIGGASYIRAKLGHVDKVIVGLGAGVSTEKTMPEAKEVIKKRLVDLEKTRTSLRQQFSQVAEKMNEDKERFESLVAEMRKENSQQNV